MINNNRRNFLTKAIALGAVLPFAGIIPLSGEPGDNNPLPLLKGSKILFTYGGWNGHEPEKFRDYMVPWLKEEGAEV